MSVSVERPDLAGRLQGLAEAAREGIVGALREGAEEVAAEARRSLGRTAPSRPGEPPADEAGVLAASIRTEVEAESLNATVSVEAPQARFLEFGTRRMAARPFLRPAVAATSDALRDRLKRAMAQAVSSVGETS